MSQLRLPTLGDTELTRATARVHGWRGRRLASLVASSLYVRRRRMGRWRPLPARDLARLAGAAGVPLEAAHQIAGRVEAWSRKHYDFRAHQRAAGQASGRARRLAAYPRNRTIRDRRDRGETAARVARRMGISRSTVYRVPEQLRLALEDGRRHPRARDRRRTLGREFAELRRAAPERTDLSPRVTLRASRTITPDGGSSRGGCAAASHTRRRRPHPGRRRRDGTAP